MMRTVNFVKGVQEGRRIVECVAMMEGAIYHIPDWNECQIISVDLESEG